MSWSWSLTLSLSLFVGTETDCQLTRAVVGTANTTLGSQGAGISSASSLLCARARASRSQAYGAARSPVHARATTLAIRLKPDRTSPRQSTDAAANWPTMKKSVSVIIACLNEEENLEGTYGNVVAALQGAIDDYEILIFDDGSTDRTGEIAGGSCE